MTFRQTLLTQSDEMLSLLITRKKSVGDQWKQKTAEEAELLLSEEEDEDECYQGKDSQAATDPPSSLLF